MVSSNFPMFTFYKGALSNTKVRNDRYLPRCLEDDNNSQIPKESMMFGEKVKNKTEY